MLVNLYCNGTSRSINSQEYGWLCDLQSSKSILRLRFGEDFGAPRIFRVRLGGALSAVVASVAVVHSRNYLSVRAFHE